MHRKTHPRKVIYNLDHGRQLFPGMFSPCSSFWWSVSGRYPMVIQAVVRQSGYSRKWPYKPAIGTDLVDLKSSVSLSISLNLLRHQKKCCHMTMVSKYPQNTPSPGTPIGIFQFRVTVRAITNKRSTSMKILC